MAIDEYFPGGVTAEQGVQNAKRLADAGVSAIDCMAGVYESMHYIVPPVYLPKGVLVNLAEAVKKEVSIPVIAQGRLYDPEIAEGVLRDGKADFIQMARGLLADPDWVNKVEHGREDDIRRCISCNRCFDRILKAQPIRCAINPVAGRESEFAETPAPAPRRKKVVIVGAGPAGMEAARVCAEKGHKVTLFEKTATLAGGQINLAAHAPGKDEFLNVVTYYKARFKKLKNLKVVLKKNASLADIRRAAPDAVILATGAGPMIPEIDGIHGKDILTLADVMSDKAKLHGKIVIAGGGCAGIDCANYLSSQNCDVTVVEALNECALDEELITRLTLLYALSQRPNLKLMTGQTISRITAKGVWARDQAHQEQLIQADHVVIALGFVSHNTLEAGVKKIVKQCTVIGDAREPGKIMEAVSAGFFAAEEV
jgi:NADPH-dependent 2,4-dienoyl-CoA reductase/sulfur reductase-like enzyme